METTSIGEVPPLESAALSLATTSAGKLLVHGEGEAVSAIGE